MQVYFLAATAYLLGVKLYPVSIEMQDFHVTSCRMQVMIGKVKL